ncbi:MAG: DGQHR domain-containing protein, partial [Planktothrix sp.]
MSTITFHAFKIVQNETPMLVFIASARLVYERFDVSRRIEDKILGYQRSFSKSRIKEIQRYINQEQGIIPNSILVNLDQGKYSYS